MNEETIPTPLANYYMNLLKDENYNFGAEYQNEPIEDDELIYVVLKGIQDGNWEVIAVTGDKEYAEEIESTVELEAWEFTDIQTSLWWEK